MSRILSIVVITSIFVSCQEQVIETSDPVAPVALGLINSVIPVGDDIYETTSNALGEVRVSEENGIVSLHLDISGLEPNSSHAVHLHNGTCEDPGTHWNQNSDASFCGVESLGVPWNRSKAGDIGNIVADADGRSQVIFRTNLYSLNSGEDSDILNKVLVIHQRREEFGSDCFVLSAHDHSSNPKIACGIILSQD